MAGVTATDLDATASAAAVLAVVSHPVVVLDQRGRITSLNPAASAALARPDASAVGRVLAHALVDETGEALQPLAFLELATGAFGPDVLTQVIDPTGRPRWLRWAAAMLTDDDGALRHVVVTGTDVTVERRAHDQLVETTRRYRVLLENASDMVVCLDASGVLTHLSASVMARLGHEPSAWLGRSAFELIHPDDIEEALVNLSATVDGTADQSPQTVRVRAAWGTWTPFEVFAKNQLDDPHVAAVVISMRDVTARLRHEAELERSRAALEQMANHDSLTGLVNRACFEAHLAEACADAPSHGSVALLFIDLNEFKAINDTYGHAMGDLVLQEAANRVREALRPGDLAARIGGDELAAVLLGVDDGRADQVTERLRAAIAEPMEVGGQHIRLTASIGHVCTSTPVDAGAFLVRADQAMYADKRSRS